MKKIIHALMTLFILAGLLLGQALGSLPSAQAALQVVQPPVTAAMLPAYTGAAYTVVHNNQPYFTQQELTTTAFEYYSPQDALGRCGMAVASVGLELMPTEERGPIGMVKPAGWHTVKYACVDGKYLYNRCHLLGFQLTGENANERNLITGTRYLNIQGMLPWENRIADYVRSTGNHVMYRVTPLYQGQELLARALLMEGWSVEDGGAGICFCIVAHNVQPGVRIDYATGASSGGAAIVEQQEEGYIVNISSHKFHRPHCSSVSRMKPSNRKAYKGPRERLIHGGFVPCKMCNP